MGIHFVNLSEKHLDPCAALFVAVFNTPPWNDAWTHETVKGRLAEILATPGFRGLVAMDDAVVGFIIGNCEQWFDGMHFCVKEMCVRPDLQGQGIGTQLLQRLEESLRAEGVTLMYLLTLRGSPAAEFYGKRGYRASRRMAAFTRRLA
jgi:aminoglycoside 6'-N-acetyltransferase I